MGPNFWRHPANGLKKCSEKTRTSCTDHDDCCAVTACTYCLELEVYGDPVQHGVADQAANHWTGTVGGYPFDMYWERNYETGVCELIVIFDGEEVYRKSCEDGQSCRDSSDEVEVIVGYPPESATLRWIKHEPLQLPHIDDPDTGCKTWFCGECECSCDCLCAIITDSYGEELGRGELCNVNYDCEGPLWEGTIAEYVLSLALGRDEYGECIITANVDGYDQPPVSVTGCKDLAATIVLEDDTTITVECKICSCNDPVPPCCGREDLPSTLTATITDLVNCTCNDWLGVEIPLSRDVFTPESSPGVSRWGGCIKGPCTVINGVGTDQGLTLILECTLGPIGQGGIPTDFQLWILQIGDIDPCPGSFDDIEYGPAFLTPSAIVQYPPSTCSPLVLICRNSDDAFAGRCQDPMAPPGVSEIEFTVTE